MTDIVETTAQVQPGEHLAEQKASAQPAYTDFRKSESSPGTRRVVVLFYV
jgi:hypothetical protein